MARGLKCLWQKGQKKPPRQQRLTPLHKWRGAKKKERSKRMTNKKINQTLSEGVNVSELLYSWATERRTKSDKEKEN